MIFWGILQIQISEHLKIQDGGHFFQYGNQFCTFGHNVADLSDINIYFYIFAYAKAFCVLFSPFKYITITFEAILTHLFMHI